MGDEFWIVENRCQSPRFLKNSTKSLNKVTNRRFLPEKFCETKLMSYICNVFFIVLDLRLTKGWSTAVLLFLCLPHPCLAFTQLSRVKQGVKKEGKKKGLKGRKWDV